jgi:hypothetical protein
MMQARRLFTTTATTVSAVSANTCEALTRASIKVVEGPKNVGRKAIAARDLKIGSIINEFSAPVFRHPTMHTVCLTNGVHVPPTFGAEFISHACGVDTNISMVVQPDARSVKVVVTKTQPVERTSTSTITRLSGRCLAHFSAPAIHAKQKARADLFEVLHI